MARTLVDPSLAKVPSAEGAHMRDPRHRDVREKIMVLVPAPAAVHCECVFFFSGVRYSRTMPSAKSEILLSASVQLLPISSAAISQELSNCKPAMRICQWSQPVQLARTRGA